MIFLIIFCTLSVALNALLIWYIRKMLTKLLFISDNIGDLLERMGGFSVHLETVHEMETFYGDPTLSELIVHSKEIVEEIRGYREIYALADPTLYNYGEEVDTESEEH